MAPTASLALNWILFLALFPMVWFWLRRAWRIAVKRDFAEVALKRGEPAPDAARWAPYTMVINGLAGVVVAFVIGSVLFVGMPFDTWTAMAGSTIWLKFMADFALSRHAHGLGAKKPR